MMLSSVMSNVDICIGPFLDDVREIYMLFYEENNGLKPEGGLA